MNDNQQQNQPSGPGQPQAGPPQAQPVQLQPVIPPPDAPKPKAGLPKSPYLYALLTFLLGIGIGYLLITQFPGSKTNEEPVQKAQTAQGISLPDTAIDLNTCIEKKGNLHADPAAVPQGPIYLVNGDNVVGLEYVLSQEEFEQGKIYEDLASLNITVNHMQVASLSASYDGKPGNYYSVNLYTVDKQIRDTITCGVTEPSPSIPDASSSASISTLPEISEAPLPVETQDTVTSIAPSPIVNQ